MLKNCIKLELALHSLPFQLRWHKQMFLSTLHLPFWPFFTAEVLFWCAAGDQLSSDDQHAVILCPASSSVSAITSMSTFWLYIHSSCMYYAVAV